MSFQQESLQQFLSELSAHTSTPGGGTVAALVSAMAAGLGSMVASFSQGERFAEVRSRMVNLEKDCQQSRDHFLELADRDTITFQELMNAFQLPTDSMERRREAVQAALKNACQVPAALGEGVLSLQDGFDFLRGRGNHNLISDVGAALSLFAAALEVSSLNIQINLRQIQDEREQQRYREVIGRFLSAASRMREQVGEIQRELEGEKAK